MTESDTLETTTTAGLTYNVKNFGALGDGSTDDREAIQRAIDAAYEAGGGTVYMPIGEYRVSGIDSTASKGAIVLKDNVTLKGAGMGKTIIKVADGYADDIAGIVRTVSGEVTKNVTIMNLTIDGNRANSTGLIDGFFTGVTPGSAEADEDITVTHVEVRECSGYGFDPHERTIRLTITDSKAHHNGKDGFVADYLIDSIFRNNKAWDNDRHGFNITTSTHDFLMEDNIAYSNGGAGIAVQRGDQDLTWPEDIIIKGGSYYNNDVEGILILLAQKVTISEANIYGNGRQGIRIEGSDFITVKDNNIHDNSQIKTNTYDEVLILDYDDRAVSGQLYGSDHNIIANNNIISDGEIRSRFGVYEEMGRSDYNEVTANKVDGPLSGTIVISGEHSVGLDEEGRVTGTVRSDTLEGDAESNVINALEGNDLVSGDKGDDLVEGGDGHDNLLGESGSDTLAGGKGSDVIKGGADNDAIEGATGSDTLSGGVGNDSVSASDGYDLIAGESGNDTLLGGKGGDTIKGDDGNDTVYGDTGNDTLYGGKANDDLSGGDGSDVLYGQTGDDSLAGGKGGDILYGGGGIDILNGQGGDDKLFGGTENDTLLGTDGNDTLDGGSGIDLLKGGMGSDVFVFAVLSHSTTPKADTIEDFTVGADTIDLSSLVTRYTGIQQGAATGTVLGYSVIDGNTVITADGSSFSVILSGKIALDNEDFVF